jgi:hypothetical protein
VGKSIIPLDFEINIVYYLSQTKEENMDVKESVLAEAERLINGDRQKAYSHPYYDYKKTVGAFNALTGHQLTVQDGIIFMVCVKLSREAYLHKRDNVVDACGYLGCLEKVIDRIEEEKLGGGQC